MEANCKYSLKYLESWLRDTMLFGRVDLTAALVRTGNISATSYASTQSSVISQVWESAVLQTFQGPCDVGSTEDTHVHHPSWYPHSRLLVSIGLFFCSASYFQPQPLAESSLGPTKAGLYYYWGPKPITIWIQEDTSVLAATCVTNLLLSSCTALPSLTHNRPH